MADLGPVLPRAFVTELIGAERAEQVRFTDQVLAALGKISPDLVPTLYQHPYADLILRGPGAFASLIERADKAPDDTTRAAAIDAIAEVITRDYATREAVEALTRMLSTSKSELVVSNAARAIALAGDEGFLEQQRAFLASKSPSEVRVAAKLCGYGKYRRAVPLLLDLLRDDQLALSDVVIWALGEIGDPSALPKLHRMLGAHLRVELVVEAIGKIGEPSSVVRLLPVLLEGATEQRERAAQAIERITRKNNGQLYDAELERSVRVALERVIEQDESKRARFHALIAFSLLGGHLEPQRILGALGAELGHEELDAMSSFFTKGGRSAAPTAKKSPPKGRKPV